MDAQSSSAAGSKPRTASGPVSAAKSTTSEVAPQAVRPSVSSVLSPLALTRALPFLPLSRGDIDYHSDWRADPGLIGKLLGRSDTTVMLVHDGLVAVPHGQGAKADYEAGAMRLATLPGAYLAAVVGSLPSGVIPVFLGAYGCAASPDDEDVRAVVSIDLTALAAASQGAADTAAVADSARPSHSSSSAASLLYATLHRFDWAPLRGFSVHATSREVGQAASAVSLGVWHASQRHCPQCGKPVEVVESGWAHRCTSPTCPRHDSLLFPRIEPAVITSIVDAQDRLLIQHNKAWKSPTMYSLCAGFVEAGESLEHACRREAYEETGLRLGEVRYLGSQPWPFPSSLMVAFKAQTLGGKPHVDGVETEDARFVTRDEFTALLASGKVEPVHKSTIARVMIEEWYGRPL